MKQQVRALSACNFSSWEYMSELSVVMIFCIFLYVRISEIEEMQLFIGVFFSYYYKCDP